MLSRNIAIAGGTGNIGRAIFEELVAHGGYKVFILGRKVCLALAAPCLYIEFCIRQRMKCPRDLAPLSSP